MSWSTATFRQLVEDAMRPLPPTLPAGTDCRAAVARMAALAAPCALILDAEGRPAGMLTDQDVTRRVAFQVPAGTPVEQVMTREVPSVGTRERLYQAVSRMRRHGWRLMLVTDETGRPAGLLELDAALVATSSGLIGQMERLAPGESGSSLRAIKQAETEVAAEMLGENVPAHEIQAFLTDINRDICYRVVDQSLAAMLESGWGEPPVRLCVLMMGSGGRGENYLDPDQDNGFILGEYPDEEHAAVDRFFVELAERVTRQLDAVGFPLCHGNVMATNPVWRKTLSQWRDQVEGWVGRRSINATLQADIFFDFHSVYGDETLAADLRRHVLDKPRHKAALLQAMARDDSSHAVALGLFGRLAAEGQDSINRGRIELKLHGVMPLVGCIRVMALAAGIGDTGTLKRIERLNAAGDLTRADADALIAAYGHVAFLVLRQQVADIRRGRPPGDHVMLAALTAQERDLLSDSLKSIDRLRKRTQLELSGMGV